MTTPVHNTAMERVAMESNEARRVALLWLNEGRSSESSLTPEQARVEAAQVLLDSVIKQARWAAGQEN